MLVASGRNGFSPLKSGNLCGRLDRKTKTVERQRRKVGGERQVVIKGVNDSLSFFSPPSISAAFHQRAAAFRPGKDLFFVMLIGLILAVVGFVITIAYSGIIGGVLLVVGVGLAIKGYEPAEEEKFSSSRQETGGGSMTYEISSRKRR